MKSPERHREFGRLGIAERIDAKSVFEPSNDDRETSESRPESRSGKSSDSGASLRFCSTATCSNCSMTVDLTDMLTISLAAPDVDLCIFPKTIYSQGCG